MIDVLFIIISLVSTTAVLWFRQWKERRQMEQQIEKIRQRFNQEMEELRKKQRAN